MRNKYFQLLWWFCCTFICSYAQPPLPLPSDSTPANCSWDLVGKIFDDISVASPQYYGKNSGSPAYSDVAYSVEYENCDDDGYGCEMNDNGDLVYMAYYPTHHNYLQAPLPVLLLFHPGGFSDCSKYTLDMMDSLCVKFARRGFITFNCEYRRGRLIDLDDTINANGYTSVQQNIAAYKGIQDARGAIRSVITLERNHVSLGLPFQIDTTKMFIGGASAGGVAAIGAAYYHRQGMVDSSFPVAAGTSKFKDVLQPIDADFYYGASTIDYYSKIKGVLGMWCGIPIPKEYENNQTNFFLNGINANNIPRFIGFHGADDNIFPITNEDNRQQVFFSPSTHSAYNSTTQCLPPSKSLRLEGNPFTYDIISGSSLNMYHIVKDVGNLAEMYIECHMKHGLDEKDGPTFNSDFGTGFHTQEELWEYIVERTACFFQLVLNNVTPDYDHLTTLFIDCQNNRSSYSNSCNYLNENSSCADDEDCAGHIYNKK
ncbi:MAG TPA: hypothetical protein PLA68_03550 [Panacibacter sp.]|nr:hypothetical protein [Panacibacter sp.]